jgi:hypothetical protein
MHISQKALLLSLFLIVSLSAQAQLEKLFAIYDTEFQAERSAWHPPLQDPLVQFAISSSLPAVVEPAIMVDTINGWRNWRTIENYAYGKDRGTMEMIIELEALHPYFRDKIVTLINNCKAQGITLAVVESYRTHAKQNEYKTMGKKYTRSGGGKSKHQYGLAVDLVPMVDSVAVWDNIALWKKIGVTGEKLGLRWGGRWKKPYDPGHFEWTGGITTKDLAYGKLPPVPRENYPCLHDDIKLLRKYWKEWEVSQSMMTRR